MYMYMIVLKYIDFRDKILLKGLPLFRCKISFGIYYTIYLHFVYIRLYYQVCELNGIWSLIVRYNCKENKSIP